MYLDSGAEEAKVEYLKFDINLPFKDQMWGFTEKDLVFDCVFCLEVMEYVWNPVQAIKNIYEMMSNDSVLYMSWPSIYPVHQPVEIDSLRYTKNVILKYLNMFGFTQIEIIQRVATSGFQALSAFYGFEGMHPVRKSNLPYDIGYLTKCRKLNY